MDRRRLLHPIGSNTLSTIEVFGLPVSKPHKARKTKAHATDSKHEFMVTSSRITRESLESSKRSSELNDIGLGQMQPPQRSVDNSAKNLFDTCLHNQDQGIESMKFRPPISPPHMDSFCEGKTNPFCFDRISDTDTGNWCSEKLYPRYTNSSSSDLYNELEASSHLSKTMQYTSSDGDHALGVSNDSFEVVIQNSPTYKSCNCQRVPSDIEPNFMNQLDHSVVTSERSRYRLSMLEHKTSSHSITGTASQAEFLDFEKRHKPDIEIDTFEGDRLQSWSNSSLISSSDQLCQGINNSADKTMPSFDSELKTMFSPSRNRHLSEELWLADKTRISNGLRINQRNRHFFEDHVSAREINRSSENIKSRMISGKAENSFYDITHCDSEPTFSACKKTINSDQCFGTKPNYCQNNQLNYKEKLHPANEIQPWYTIKRRSPFIGDVYPYIKQNDTVSSAGSERKIINRKSEGIRQKLFGSARTSISSDETYNRTRVQSHGPAEQKSDNRLKASSIEEVIMELDLLENQPKFELTKSSRNKDNRGSLQIEANTNETGNIPQDNLETSAENTPLRSTNNGDRETNVDKMDMISTKKLEQVENVELSVQKVLNHMLYYIEMKHTISSQASQPPFNENSCCIRAMKKTTLPRIKEVKSNVNKAPTPGTHRDFPGDIPSDNVADNNCPTEYNHTYSKSEGKVNEVPKNSIWEKKEIDNTSTPITHSSTDNPIINNKPKPISETCEISDQYENDSHCTKGTQTQFELKDASCSPIRELAPSEQAFKKGKSSYMSNGMENSEGKLCSMRPRSKHQ